jgi:Fe-Mn family superoxide dismutase
MHAANNIPGSAEDYSSTTKNLLIKYARQPSMASLFNHASMAHNNHFFFSTLSTTATTMPASLQKGIEASFTSVETLRREFIATANAMFGPGFVWLVKTKEGKFSLLTTYIAGSPYPGAHWRLQAKDMNTEPQADVANAADYYRQQAMANMPIVNAVGAHGRFSSTAKIAPGGVDVNPILCVNTWQHVYMPDWGVLQKKQYLEAWWDRIDWNVVADAAGEKFQASKFIR